MRISDWSSDVCSSVLPLDQLLALGLGVRLLQIDPQAHALLFEVDGKQHVLQRLGADLRGERLLAEIILCGEVVLLGEELMQLQEIGRASCRERVCPYA